MSWLVYGAVLEVLRLADLGGLAAEWDKLALRTGAPPFVRPGWIAPWWATFGAGELLLVTTRRDGALTGVLPLSRRHGILRTCGNVHSGLFDLVAEEDGDADALMHGAVRLGRGMISLRVAEDGKMATAARRISDADGCEVKVLRSEPCSRIEAASYEEWEKGLKSKRRSDNRRVAKRLGELGELGFREAEASDPSEAEMDDFLRLEATPWKVEQGTSIKQSPAERAFYEEIAGWGGTDDPSRLTFEILDGRPIATQISVDGGGVRYGLKTGFDDELGRYSPGLFLQVAEIRRALEAGLSFELGTGNEPLKRDLRTSAWDMATMAIFPTSLRGRLGRIEVGARTRLRQGASGSQAMRRGRDLLRARRTQSLR